jgi:hypothetical protein
LSIVSTFSTVSTVSPVSTIPTVFHHSCASIASFPPGVEHVLRRRPKRLRLQQGRRDPVGATHSSRAPPGADCVRIDPRGARHPWFTRACHRCRSTATTWTDGIFSHGSFLCFLVLVLVLILVLPFFGQTNVFRHIVATPSMPCSMS